VVQWSDVQSVDSLKPPSLQDNDHDLSHLFPLPSPSD
jgi:hypothetical protein